MFERDIEGGGGVVGGGEGAVDGDGADVGAVTANLYLKSWTCANAAAKL